ncbi:hypothetical protein Q4595_14470 [Wenyingzhuangia sp. 1_MG-2023]|nr:hypothetical protein [Wenyingzhuangia sp. 1_MG-2023]
MLKQFKILYIRKLAIQTLESTSHIKFQLHYRIIPFIISLVISSFNSKISENNSGILVTGISIFAGLLFSLLFIVTDKLNLRRVTLSTDKNEEVINYLKRYKSFAKKTIHQISYTILLSILLILLIFLNDYPDWLNFECPYYSFIAKKYFGYSLKFFFYYSSLQFLYFLLTILASMFSMLSEDITKEF